MLPTTVDRVPQATAEEYNLRIRQEMEDRLARIERSGPAAIEKRLEELDAEWDIERVLETNASTAVLIGVSLGTFVNKRFFVLPAVVAGFLMQHALQGWCPPVPFFRWLGVRTQGEIEQERYALKAIRGDFQRVAEARLGKATAAVQATDR
jgi:hypothetical protein